MSLNTDVKSILVMHDLAFEHFPNHNSFLVRNFYKYFFPKYAQKANKIVAVSNFTKQDIVSKYNISPKKIEIGYCGVSDLYKPVSQAEKHEIKKNISLNEDYFICIGSLNPRKNISSAVKAYNILKKETGSQIKLLIVGAKGWKTEKLFNEINNSPFKDDIIRTGHLKPKVLSKYLAASKALIFPSLFEGFGIPIVEAFQCKIPVVTSDASSTKEIGKDLAIIINPNDIESIKNAMKKIVENNFILDPDNKVRNDKLHIYNWDRTSKNFRDIIMKSLAQDI